MVPSVSLVDSLRFYTITAQRVVPSVAESTASGMSEWPGTTRPFLRPMAYD